CQLEKPVVPLVLDTSVGTSQIPLCLASVVAVLLLARQGTVATPDLGKRLLEELRAFNRCAVAEGEKGFQSKVHTHDITRCDRTWVVAVLASYAQPEIIQLVPFNGDGLDRAFNLSTLAVLVDRALNPDAVSIQQLPT